MNKTKSLLTIAVFCVIIFGLAALHIITEDSEISLTERRKTAQAPEFSIGAFLSGDYAGDLEDYLSDQFPFRDGFRGIKAALSVGVFRQSDTNGYFLYEDSIIKTEYPLKENQVGYAATLFQTIYDNHLSGMNVYLSIIPDKGYFTRDTGHPALKYDRLVEIMRDGFSSAEYIDIFGCLSLADYYLSDSHWRQDRIFAVVEALADSMGISEHITPQSEYERNTLYPFYGVYLQSALPVSSEEIVYLESSYTESSVLKGYEFEGEKPLYTLENFDGLDGYDIFLNGAQAILEINCPDAKTDKELIIFRDSYGSSLAPLFTGAYSKITIVDLRYFSSSLLGEFIEFKDQDVLFIHSTTLLNSGMIMR